jgi:putative acetyltransferase
MAVHPEHQRKGAGSALVERGLEVCRERGERIVVVLGHPDYYPRFGFRAAAAAHLHAPWSGEAWMALELVRGALAGVAGVMKYPEAFMRSEAD